MTDTPDPRDTGTTQTGFPLRHALAGPPAAVSVDLVEPGAAQQGTGGDVLVPRYVLVNGWSMFTPAGTVVRITTEPGGTGVEVVLSFLARRVRIGFAEELGIDLDETDGDPPAYALILARAFATGDGLDFAGHPVPPQVASILEACERVPDTGEFRGPDDLLALLHVAAERWGAARIAQAAALLATGHDPAGRDVADPPGQDGPDAPLWRGWTRHGNAVPGMLQLGEHPPRARCTGQRGCEACIADATRARALVLGVPPAEQG